MNLKNIITSACLTAIIGCSSIDTPKPLPLTPSVIDYSGTVVELKGAHGAVGMNTHYTGTLRLEDNTLIPFTGFGRIDYKYLKDNMNKIVSVDCRDNYTPCYIEGLK